MFGWRKMRSLFMSDEELGKKDDDHKTVKNVGQRRSPSWQAARVPPRRSLKRFGLVFVVAAFVYLFVTNIPVLGPNDRMRRPAYPPSTFPDGLLKKPPPGPPPFPPLEQSPHPPDPFVHSQPSTVNVVERNFNGPLRFLELPASLLAISETRGGQLVNRNVLFAASSLRSAATLLPMACQMGTELKSYVHFALLGRSGISLEQLWEINGIDRSCAIIFHDARPNYAEISTDERLEHAALRGFYNINVYMHPQAIIVDGSSDEEGFFARAVRQHVKVSRTTLIELPRKAAKALAWVTKVDSASLRMWDKINIDILIQASPGSLGSLKRLLRSLSAADYTSSAIPHITIELPHNIDTPTKRFLETFTWPPPHMYNPTNAQYLSLRHRIHQQRLTEEETSTRFLESFWPARPQESHILVLSPHAEVSSQFFSCNSHHWDRHLFGISLEQPLLTPNGKQTFSPPLFHDPDTLDGHNGGISNPFLWQAPTSNAVLFLGERWMELHDFISRMIRANKNLNAVPPLLSEKVVSRQHPSWLEHALRLARARGHWFLYPGKELAQHLAAVHGELYNIPEEYASEESPKVSLLDDASDEENESIKQKVRSGSEIQLSPISLLDSLPSNGNLWPLSALSIAAWDGTEVNLQDFRNRANDFELKFKSAVGGCDVESGKGQKNYEPTLAQDLFCNVE
ncbi:hypothetical protein F5Y19DRAFT_490941 [Xylariaceae sp. FL1651]|nr:hypothetical protein F5Y19DRAFT_490941 [Xylariaceae sp. FL1651]